MAKQQARPTRAIFKDKLGGARYQGVVTAAGSTSFEMARKRLAKMAGREVEQTSDGDVFEFLARGEDATRKYLATLA
jgi:hypothetical protein